MADPFESTLADLGFSLPEWCQKPTEHLVQEYEAQFELDLPADYREFLRKHGGVFGNATCEFQEPTPCGTSTTIDHFYGFPNDDMRESVASATEMIEGAPDVAALGDNQTGAMFWLKCTGDDRGHVYMHDHQGRSAWADEQFTAWFPNLHSSIKDYLALRKAGKLPKKPKGYEHVYRLATSFTEFLSGLKKAKE